MSRTLELLRRPPEHAIVSASVEALADAHTAFGDVPITATNSPEHGRLFYSVGNHFLMLGGVLRFQVNGLAKEAGIELHPKSSDPHISEPVNHTSSELAGVLIELDQLAYDMGRDDLHLESEPTDSDVEELTLRQQADIVVAKFSALDRFRNTLPELVAISSQELITSPNLENQVMQLSKVLNPKIKLRDRVEALRQSKAGKALSKVVLTNAIGGVAYAVAQLKLNNTAASVGDVAYAVFAASLDFLYNERIQKWLLRRDMASDVIQFTRSEATSQVQSS